MNIIITVSGETPFCRCHAFKMASKSMVNLPLEILERIFVYMSTKDLAKCSRVCKKWYKLLENEDSAVWRGRFEVAGSKQFRSCQHLSELISYKSKVLAYECAWSDNDHSNNIYLLEDCLTLHRKPVAQSSDGIRGKTAFLHGQHYFVVIFQGPSFGSSALVGVCTKNAPVHAEGYVPLLGNSEYGWAWDISMSTLKHNGNVIKEDYGVSFISISMVLSGLMY